MKVNLEDINEEELAKAIIKDYLKLYRQNLNLRKKVKQLKKQPITAEVIETKPRTLREMGY